MRKRKTRCDKISISKEQLIVMEKLAGFGLTVKQICHVLGFSPDTVYRRINEGDDEISATLLRGKSASLSKVAEKAFELALNGDSGMIKYILSTQGGWSEKSQITVNGGENPLLISNITDKQLKRMAHEYAELAIGDEDE